MNKLLVLVLLPYLSQCSIDFYLPEDQVEKLFGIEDAEMYYIRNGIVNENAVNFIARVEPEHTELNYVWRATNPDITVVYDLVMDVQENNVHLSAGSAATEMRPLLNNPQISEMKKGTIPYTNELKPHAWKVTLDCTGFREGNATFTMKLNLKLHSEVSGTNIEVNIKRLKKCLKTHSWKDEKTSSVDNQHDEQTDQDLNSLSGTQQSTSAFYISVSVVSTLIVMIVVVVTVWHVRLSK
uniref:WIF domain-containing protein n=1 Tax=Ciona savignyi TaxID=51511 RepID=H2Y715_CIOSA